MIRGTIKKIDIISKTNKKYFCVTFGCVSFIDSQRFLSKNLDKLVETFVDNSHKPLNNLQEENVDNDEILIIFNEI